MEKQKSYHLVGLKLVSLGMILELVIGAVSAVAKSLGLGSIPSANLATVIYAGALLLCSILIIVGLGRVKGYSDKYRKARNCFVWRMLLEIGVGVILVAGAFLLLNTMDEDGNMAMPESASVAIVVLIVVLGALTAIIDILCVKNLMGGCAQIAKAHQDKKYSRKCTRTWIWYIILFLVLIVLGIATLISGGNGLVESLSQNGGAIETVSDMAGNMDHALLLMGGTIFILLLLFFAYIGVIARVRGTYSRFNKATLPGQEEKPVQEEPKALPKEGQSTQTAATNSGAVKQATPQSPQKSEAPGTKKEAVTKPESTAQQIPSQPHGIVNGQEPVTQVARKASSAFNAPLVQGQAVAETKETVPQGHVVTEKTSDGDIRQGSGTGSLPDLPDLADLSEEE